MGSQNFRDVVAHTKREVLRRTLYNRSAPLVVIETILQRRAFMRWVRGVGPRDVPPAMVKHKVIRDYAGEFGVKVFVETGTFLGDTTYALRNDFDRLITIELDGQLAAAARRRLRDEPHVTVLEGDSAKLIPRVLETLDQPALFWLDAHYSGGVTALGDVDSPLASELNSILNAELTHIVLIDDARLLGRREGYPAPEVLANMARSGGRELLIETGIARITPSSS